MVVKVQSCLLSISLLLMGGMPTLAQVVTTLVSDTVYRADGTPASGTILISWPAFTTGEGQAVASGSAATEIGADGAFSLQLAPNSGATPYGSYYTAILHLDDGSVNTEYWMVPLSQVPVTLSIVRSSLLPTSVAMQTASKAYVDSAIAAAVSGVPLSSSTPYVQKTGDTMTGPLVLPGDPSASSQAADKHYVDTGVAAATTGLAQKVTTAPQATQVIAQPTGTQIQTNRLNSVEYASQYASGRGSNGIANAVQSADCLSGCDVKAEVDYSQGETYVGSDWNNATHVEDERGGGRRDTYMNPHGVVKTGDDAGQVINVTSTASASGVFQATASQEPASEGLIIEHQGLTGGSNLHPASVEGAVPYFKSTYAALSLSGTYNTPGQHILAPGNIACYGVGDCLIGSQFILASGGFRDEADEGAHPYDLQVQEDPMVFQGICSTGCTTGSSALTVGISSGAGTQGEGRFLIDKNPTKVISTGILTGGVSASTGGIGPSAFFSGTTFPVSTFFATAQMIPSQANDIAPGTVVVGIATSGVPSGFATSTTAAPSTSGVACLTDPVNGYNPTNYEMASYSVVDASHLTMALKKVHAARKQRLRSEGSAATD